MQRALTKTLADIMPALGLLLITIAYLTVAYQYSPALRAFPVMVAWSMIALLALDLVARTPTKLGRAVPRWLNPASAAAETTHINRRDLVAVLWVAGFVTALVLVGVPCAVLLFVFASARWRGKRSYAVSLLLAVATMMVIWLLFTQLLRIELYPGILLGGA
jgi:hypothetical protein